MVSLALMWFVRRVKGRGKRKERNLYMDSECYIYDRTLLNEKATLGKELFETTVNNRKEYNPADEERALKIIRYAFEYYHLSRCLVSEGSLVLAGDSIGNAGSTGRSTGPHLHITVKCDGVSINPAILIDRIRRHRY